MKDTILKKIKNAPNACGVYLIKSNQGKIIYIGKAVSIRKRLKSHFSPSATSSKQQALVKSAHDIDYMFASSPEAALLLEAALIKKYSPKYNADLKDDKAYPLLKLTIKEDFPRLSIVRRKMEDGSLYFGPYTNAKLLRKALKLMSRLFPLRSCRIMSTKVCLNFHIGQCLGPCVEQISKQEYKSIVKNVILFLKGESDQLQESLIEDMKKASSAGNFELAAYIREQIKAVSSVTSKKGDRHLFSDGKRCLSPFLTQLQDLSHSLGIHKALEIIEAFDVSNTAGKEAVGSMVVFKDGKPYNDGYRRFKIRTVKGIDDYSMIREIVERRYFHLTDKNETLPDLIIIDGGKGHLMSAKKQLHQLGIWKVPVISIAKRFELVYTHENKSPLELDPASPALLLLQRIRNEAHRFAIDYHRLLRRKKIPESELDSISGIGHKKKKLLLEHFGSVDEIKMAEAGDLTKVKYINEKQAREIYNYFNSL